MNDPENIYKLLPLKLAADWDFALINKAEGRALMQSNCNCLGDWQQGNKESKSSQVLGHLSGSREWDPGSCRVSKGFKATLQNR